MQVPREFVAGLSFCSPGPVCLSVCCFCSDTALSPQSRNPLVLASAAPLLRSGLQSFPLWSQFLHLNKEVLGLIRKVTCRVVSWFCCGNSQDIGKGAEGG